MSLSTPFDPPLPAVRDAVARALAEDLGALGDITAALVPASATVLARLRSRAVGVLAGCGCADEAFQQVDTRVEVTWHRVDGAELAPGDVVATVQGPLAPVLTAERTGSLADVTQMLGSYYEEEAETRMRSVVKLLEPMITVIMGAVVAVVVLAVMLPIFDLSSFSQAEGH